MKLTNSFSHSFSLGSDSLDAIYKKAITIEGINGVYLSDYHLYKKEQVIWYDLTHTTNYLYSNQNSNITIIDSDPYFNDHPSIDFPNSGNEALYFKHPVEIGCILIAYLTRTSTSYLIYAPKAIPGHPDAFYYDLFPRGVNGSYFAPESNEPTNLAYNATLRINSKPTLTSSIVVLNSPKLLSLSNLGNNNLTAVISGFGGCRGEINGGPLHPLNKSVQGRIAAIITFDRNIGLDDLQELESLVATTYLNYQGPISISTPTLRYFANSLIVFDFSEIIKDEFYEITSYELLHPNYPLLVIDNEGLLSGVIDEEIYTDLVIKVTNSQNINKVFSYKLEIVIADPVIESLPKLPNLVNIFTAKYGVISDVNNNLIKIEDARRIRENLPILYADSLNIGSYIEISDQPYIVSVSNDKFVSNVSFSAKTFAWVYIQTETGYRNLLDTFSDIRGNGVLWTVSNPSETHGLSGCTTLTAYINTVKRNTISYKLKLEQIYIIVATGDNNLQYSGFSRLKGKLAFFASWNVAFTETEVLDLSYLLGQTYVTSNNPFIIDESTEYFNTGTVVVDLTKKIIDWRKLALTYELIQAPLNASISNNQLTFSTNKDEKIPISINCTNSENYSNVLNFKIDVAIRNHPLYLTLRQLLSYTEDLFEALYLITTDTVLVNEFNEVSSWLEYRFNGNNLTYINTASLVNDYSIYTGSNEYNKCIKYGSNSYALFTNSITSNIFIIAWIPDNDLNNLEYLFGSSTPNLFKPGKQILFENSSNYVLNGYKFVNNREVDNTYCPVLNVLNIAIIKTTAPVTVNSISRNVLDSSVSLKNRLFLLSFINDIDDNIETSIFTDVYTAIKNYYHPARILLLSNFNSLPITDETNLSLSTVALGTLNTQYKKFGNSSYTLINNGVFGYLNYSQQHSNYVLLNEDFTLSFWYASNKFVNEIIPLFNLMHFSIYTYANKLYIGLNYIANNSIINYQIPNTFYNNTYPFNLIEVVRKDDILYLFVNGNLVSSADFVYEFKDSTASIFLGKLGNLADNTVNLYIDGLVFYYRTALYTTDHDPTPEPSL